jgi:hypothetical protein
MTTGYGKTSVQPTTLSDIRAAHTSVTVPIMSTGETAEFDYSPSLAYPYDEGVEVTEMDYTRKSDPDKLNRILNRDPQEVLKDSRPDNYNKVNIPKVGADRPSLAAPAFPAFPSKFPAKTPVAPVKTVPVKTPVAKPVIVNEPAPTPIKPSTPKPIKKDEYDF